MFILTAATFFLCLGIILGAYWLFVVRAEQKATGALRRRLEAKRADRPIRNELTKKEAPLSAFKLLDAALEHSGQLAAPLKRTVANSALPVSVGVVVLCCGCAAILGFVIGRLLLPTALLAALFALLVSGAPYLYIRAVASKRLRKMEEQLPQAVDLIAVTLRAGHAFPTGLLMVAEEVANPLGAEFRLVYDQQNFGKPLPDVLREFADRVPILDARILVTAILTQRETGGNLAEVLDKLSAVIRERFKVRHHVRALSAHGRISGLVLGMLPIVLGFVLYLIAPSHIMTLFEDPFGQKLVAGGIVLQIIGTLSVRRIVNIEF